MWILSVVLGITASSEQQKCTCKSSDENSAVFNLAMILLNTSEILLGKAALFLVTYKCSVRIC